MNQITLRTPSAVTVRTRLKSGQIGENSASVHRDDFYETDFQKANKHIFGTICIDTEYEGPRGAVTDEDIKLGKAKVRPLSYQYCCYVYDENQLYDEAWSGICYPEEGERLTMSKLFLYAVSQAYKEAGCIKLPLTWYLTGHFTRADIPVFEDFGTLNKLTNAVRGTFVSIDRGIPLKIDFDDNRAPIDLAIRLRDTSLLLPEGSKSLQTMGELIGIPKMIVDDDPLKEAHYKQNMSQLLADKPLVFDNYAVNDAIVTAAYADYIINRTEQIVNSRYLPVTLTGSSIALLDQKWNEKGLNRLDLLGKEEITKKVWHSKLRRLQTEKDEVYLQEVHLHLALATESYHGGRNEQFWFGPTYEAAWSDFDLSSAYPTAMNLIRKPDWRAIRVSCDPAEYTPEVLGVAMVEFKFPTSTRFPTMPVRTDHGLIFPLEGISCCGAPEIALALTLGAEVKIKHGVIVPYANDERIFGEFIRFCIQERAKYPKGTVNNLFWKEFSNATYGKTAQGLREKRVYDNRDGDTKPLPPSRITNPFIAAFITSFVRATLGEVINALPAHACVHSATTDGFLTDASLADAEAATLGPISTIFSSSRNFLNGTPGVLERKHEVRCLLGFKTRGQATLIPGNSSTGGDYNLVLAKGGLYTLSTLETVAQRNEYVTRTFFGRKAADKIEVYMKTGLRDIVQHGADLVQKIRTKRLNMEYDYKRRPSAAAMHPGYNHICFYTKPWRSVAEYNTARDNWDEYYEKAQRCTKHMSDFEAFAENLLARTALCKKGAAYLSTKDPAIKRLRLLLTSAWQRSLAGFDPECRKITAAEFATILTDCGIPCSRHNAEYGVRRAFLHKSCPPTALVRAALERLSKHFPSLREEDLLADASSAHAIDLLPAMSARDDFIDRVRAIIALTL